MDILAYDYLKQGLENYNEMIGKPRGNVVVSYPTKNTTYPHTVFDEIRNIDNLVAERVASVGYRVDVYAKTKGKIDKQTIAREIAEQMNRFLTSKKLKRISYNASPQENDDSIYHIIMTYSGNLYEVRRTLI